MKNPVSQQPVDQQPEGQLTSQTLVSTPGKEFTMPLPSSSDDEALF
jgi:hypothetical protein